MSGMTIEQIRDKHPFPWRTQFATHPSIGGVFQMLDAAGKEVPIPVMCNYLSLITASAVEKTLSHTTYPSNIYEHDLSAQRQDLSSR